MNCLRIKIEHLRPEERRTCACCGKALVPRDTGGNGVMLNGESELESYRTDRRVISIRRVYHTHTDLRTNERTRRLHRIEVKFFPNSDWYWGVDGVFCTLRCGREFGRKAYKAGYRLKGKVPA